MRWLLLNLFVSYLLITVVPLIRWYAYPTTWFHQAIIFGLITCGDDKNKLFVMDIISQKYVDVQKSLVK